MKTRVRSNKMSLMNYSGYAPRVSEGTLEEMNRFQHFLMNVLDIYHIPYRNVECEDTSFTFIDEFYQEKVELILFYNYKDRYMIDLS